MVLANMGEELCLKLWLNLHQLVLDFGLNAEYVGDESTLLSKFTLYYSYFFQL